jgi:hypothetical protein
MACLLSRLGLSSIDSWYQYSYQFNDVSDVTALDHKLMELRRESSSLASASKPLGDRFRRPPQ